MKAICKRGHERIPENLTDRGTCKACIKIRRDEREEARIAAGLPAPVRMQKPRATCRKGHDNASPHTRDGNGACRQCGRDRMAERKRRVYGKIAPGIVCGRRFCPECGKWRLLLYFPRSGGRANKSGDLRMTGLCEPCIRTRSARYRHMRKNDPEAYLRHLENERIRNAERRRAEGQKPRRRNTYTPHASRKDNLGERLDPRPFLAWLDTWRHLNPDWSIEDICGWAGVAARRISLARTAVAQGADDHLTLRTIAALMDGCGAAPHELHGLYPITGGAEIAVDTAIALPFRDHGDPSLCRFRGCGDERGHGDRSNFCEEHGELLATIAHDFRTREGWHGSGESTPLEFGETENPDHVYLLEAA